MKAAVHTRYGPPDVVRIAEVDKPTVGDHDVLVKVHATTVNRTDCGFRAAQAVRRSVLQRARQAEGDDPGVRVRGGRRGGRRRRHVLRGRRQRVRLQRMAVRCARRVPVDARGRFARDHAGERDLRGGRGQHRGVALRALDDHEGEDPERAARARERRDRGDRLGGGPAPEATRRRRDRGLRHGARGAGAGLGRRPGDRLHGRGLHEGRADVRRGPRRGRQELVRPVQATVEAARDLPLVGPGSLRPESDPGARHAAVRREAGRCSPSRRSTTRRGCRASRR